jgi:hypothetical protein
MALTLALAAASVAAASTIPGPQPSERATAAQQRQQAAVDEIRRTGTQGPAVRAFIEGLPKADGLYVIEGDILMTEQEVVQRYLTARVADGKLKPGPELKINLLPSGALDRYDAAHRTLTYAVDRRTFADDASFQAVGRNVAIATTAWEKACPTCGVKFRRVKAHDAAPTHALVNFIVRNVDAHGNYIAAAFFPHDAPDRRFLNLDPSYFSTTFDKVGVIRHELGHVLGYRHEHIAGIPGCYTEDSNWKPLTAYDSKSVMHYFCGGGGSLELKLTPTDIAGHRIAYKLP